MLPRPHSAKIFRISFATLGSVCASVVLGKYRCTPAPLAVFVTSVNYWRDPKRGARRNLDISTCVIGCLYQSYMALTVRCYPYFATVGSGVGCYIVSRQLRLRGYTEESSIAHCGVHLSGNVGNMLLMRYSK